MTLSSIAPPRTRNQSVTLRIFLLLELLSYGASIALALIISALMVQTRLTGHDSVTLYFDKLGEHTFEAIFFPLFSILALGFLLKRAWDFWMKE